MGCCYNVICFILTTIFLGYTIIYIYYEIPKDTKLYGKKDKVSCALKFNQDFPLHKCVKKRTENNTEKISSKLQTLGDRFVASSDEFDLVISTDAYLSDVYLTFKKINKSAVEILTEKNQLPQSVNLDLVSFHPEAIIKIEFSVSYIKIELTYLQKALFVLFDTVLILFLIFLQRLCCC